MMSKVMEKKHRLNLARQMIRWDAAELERWSNSVTAQERDFVAQCLNELESEMDMQLLSTFDHTESMMN